MELNHIQYALQVQKQLTVSVKNAYKCYGTKRDPITVLKGLNMNVKKGTIFSLLGASGCGKTTLLSCILGRRGLDAGEIRVFGETVAAKRTGRVTGRVGYMPQEVALYGDFTIRETLLYFGWVAGMSGKSIEKRSAALTKLLLLPHYDQMVNSLSGGEKRRVSFAVALLPDTDLLILDEPTAGVDPLLREMIWDYMVKITREENVTVIVTTHYIEEARRADTIGLMRGGELLAEDAPEILIHKYAAQSLEEVFLQLSIIQDQNHQQSEVARKPCMSLSNNNEEISPHKKGDVSILDYLPDLHSDHLKALIWKNILWWIRNIPALIFMLGLPGLIVAIFCMSVRNPRDMSIAVVDYQTNNSDVCSGPVTCNGTELGCNYLEYLKKHSLRVVYYDSEAEAVKSVLHGQTYASVVLKHNYSAALRTRILKWGHSTPRDIEAASIDVVRDVSNTQIASYLKWYFYDAFSDLMRDYLYSCDMDPKILNIPIKWGSPVYGLKYPTFIDFSMPGLLLTINFTLGVLLTSFALLIERNEGNLERTFVIGITELELILGHLICGVFITVVQVALALAFGFGIFDITQTGALILVIMYALLAAFCGMCYGVLISCICESEGAINALTTGSFFPVIILGGIIWPIEGMHYLLKPVAYCLPLTKALEGLRSVLQKNWGLNSQVVLQGVLISCICESESAINALSTGSFFPVIILGGIVWPIEGMHYLLKPIALCLPLTKALEGLRSVLQKNWGLNSQVVLQGYGCMVIWMILFFFISLLYLKLRNR